MSKHLYAQELSNFQLSFWNLKKITSNLDENLATKQKSWCVCAYFAVSENLMLQSFVFEIKAHVSLVSVFRKWLKCWEINFLPLCRLSLPCDFVFFGSIMSFCVKVSLLLSLWDFSLSEHSIIFTVLQELVRLFFDSLCVGWFTLTYDDSRYWLYNESIRRIDKYSYIHTYLLFRSYLS